MRRLELRNTVIIMLVLSLGAARLVAESQDRKPVFAPLQEISARKTPPDLLITSTSNQTSEDGKKVQLLITLNQRPQLSVILSIQISDPTEADISHTKIEIPSEEWNIPKTLEITGLDDQEADGDKDYTVSIAVLKQSDIAFSRLRPRIIHLVNLDDDVPGCHIKMDGNVTSEAGTISTARVSLTSKPERTVYITVLSNDLTEGIVTPKQIVFSPFDWNSPQTIQFKGVNDFIFDGDRSYFVSLSLEKSDDSRYAKLKPIQIGMNNKDDDQPGIITITDYLETSESGDATSILVKLTSEPMSPLTIKVRSSDSSEAYIFPKKLRFTSKNWNHTQAVTVTGQDDAVADGDQAFEIGFSPSQTKEPGYVSLPEQRVRFINRDDESAGITIRKDTARVSESGEHTRVLIKLNTQPTHTVVTRFHSDNPEEGRVFLSELVFTPEDWFQSRTIRIVGVDDLQNDGDQEFHLIFSPLESEDIAYSNYQINPIPFVNVDNDTSGISVVPLYGEVTEDGGKTTFSISLKTAPVSDVIVGLNSQNISEGSVSPSTITFTSDNWNVPQKIEVIGQNDHIVDGDQTFDVTISAMSDDPGYLNIEPIHFNVLNKDINSHQLIVTDVYNQTAENGKSGSFQVQFQANPQRKIKLLIKSSDTTEGRPHLAHHTLTPENWKSPLVIKVTGIDDSIQDGNQSYAIIIEPEKSDTNTALSDFTAKVPMVNADNDQVGFEYSVLDDVTDEDGDIAKLVLKLKSEPESPVIFIFFVDDESEAVMDIAHAEFHSKNWFQEQLIQVRGAIDNRVDGDQSYYLESLGAISKDARYNGMPFPRLKLINKDRDTAGVILSGVTGDTTERGGTATFSLRLNSIPEHPVTIGLKSNDPSEGVVTPDNITINKSDWDSKKTITITGLNDNRKDNDQRYQIVLDPLISEDEDYDGRHLEPIDVYNLERKRQNLGVFSSSTRLIEGIGDSYQRYSDYGINFNYIFARRTELDLSFSTTRCEGNSTIFQYNVANPIEFNLDWIALAFGARYLFWDYYIDLFGRSSLDIYQWRLESVNLLNDARQTSGGITGGITIGLEIEVAPFDFLVLGIAMNVSYVLNGLSHQRMAITMKYPF